MISTLRNRTVVSAFMLLLCCLCVPSSYATQKPIDGHWEGALVREDAETKVAIDLKTKAEGLEGIIDLPDMIWLAFPLINLKYEPPKVHFEQSDIGVTLDGETQGDRIAGNVKIFGRTGTFYLKRAEAKPLPYTQEEVRFRNGDVTLAGTLLVPSKKGPHPAVVFTHGSGSVSRNAARYLADPLARRGVASLIYDKRGVGASAPGVDWRRASFNDLAGDALAAVQFLKNRKDINPKQIGLYGHSQGGWIVVLAASRSKDVAFIISSSGPAVPPWQQETYRVEHQMRADGFPEDEIKEAVAFMRLKFEVGRTGQGWEKLDATMQELRNKNKKWFPSYTGAPTSLEASRWYWANESSYDPAPDLKKVKVPVLAIFGELDTLVNVKESATIMEEILKKEGNRDHTIKLLPNVGHGMIVWPEKGSRWHWPRLIDGYLETITEWVLKRAHIPRAES